MTSPGHDLVHLREATDRLLAATAKLTEPDVLEPSHLPGWTRGHVLAHLARNADALGEVLAGRPMYASAEARDSDIESGASRTLPAHLSDLRESADRLDRALSAQHAEDWEREVELRNGVRDTVGSLPFRRWSEVELHHVDLGVGYSVDDLPGAFIDRQLDALARRFAGHPDLPHAVQLRAEDGTQWHTGATEGYPVVVAGSPAALVGWLSGRTRGSGLSANAALPKLPAL